MAKSGEKNVFWRIKNGFCHCAAALETQVPKLCTALDLSLLYILIPGTYSKFARKNDSLALGVCFLQPCSLLICWPINRSNRFSNFLRLDQLDRFAKIIKSIFSKFWKVRILYFTVFRIFQSRTEFSVTNSILRNETWKPLTGITRKRTRVATT